MTRRELNELQRKSPDAANGSGHGQEEAVPLPDPSLQPITEMPNVDAVKRMRLEMGVTPIEFAAEHMEDARPELLEAMKCLDSSEYRDLHVRVGKLVNELDECIVCCRQREVT